MARGVECVCRRIAFLRSHTQKRRLAEKQASVLMFYVIARAQRARGNLYSDVCQGPRPLDTYLFFGEQFLKSALYFHHPQECGSDDCQKCTQCAEKRAAAFEKQCGCAEGKNSDAEQ